MNSHCKRMSDKLLFEQLDEQAFVQSAMTSTPSPVLTTHIACRYRPTMTLLLTLYVVLSHVGWLEVTVPCQHKYGYIRDEN